MCLDVDCPLLIVLNSSACIRWRLFLPFVCLHLTATFHLTPCKTPGVGSPFRNLKTFTGNHCHSLQYIRIQDKSQNLISKTWMPTAARLLSFSAMMDLVVISEPTSTSRNNVTMRKFRQRYFIESWTIDNHVFSRNKISKQWSCSENAVMISIDGGTYFSNDNCVRIRG